MQLQQVVISAKPSRRSHGKELIHSAPSLDESTAFELLDWSPGWCDLADRYTECINFFGLSDGRLAVSRSAAVRIKGLRDNDAKLITRAYVITPEQLAGFDNNAIRLLDILMSSGHLFVDSNPVHFNDYIEISDRAIICSDQIEQIVDPRQAKIIQRAVDIHLRVAICGQHQPLRFIGSYLSHLPEDVRLDTSFTTGMKTDDERMFHLSVYSQVSHELKRELVTSQVRTMSVDRELVQN